MYYLLSPLTFSLFNSSLQMYYLLSPLTFSLFNRASCRMVLRRSAATRCYASSNTVAFLASNIRWPFTISSPPTTR